MGKNPESIVAAIDFSEVSCRALDHAAVLCVRGARLVLFHVWNPSYLVGTAPVNPSIESWIRKHTEDLASRLERYGMEAESAAQGAALRVSYRVEEGAPSRVIPALAHAEKASFLVGSTTDHVLKLADRPVLTVPAREAQPGELSA